ncbi:MAG: DUF4296 domain-containing protein [Ignavibacteriaceae bacterium]
MKNFFLVCPILLLLTFCSEQKPSVPEDKLIIIYTDLMFSQDTVLINNDNVDSLKTEVFARHNISEEDYQQTIDFYNKTPERWEKFFDRVVEYIESLKSKPEDS